MALLAIVAGHQSHAHRSALPSAGFEAHTIDTGLPGGYQVVISDLNRDGRPDVIAVASDLDEIRWYEGPTWQKHVLIGGIHDPINAAAWDVDGDGIPEIALAHEFSDVYAESLGVVSLLTHQGDPARRWSKREIDRVPTSHRLRFADVEGTGRKVLVNFPLIGPRAVAPEYRDHVPLLAYGSRDWSRRLITDADEGVVHGIFVTSWDEPGRDALLSASFLGVSLMRYQDGRWTRTHIADGEPGPWPRCGSSDVAVGRLAGERFVAAIEPWHGSHVAVYLPRADGWTRRVIDEDIVDGHTIVTGDFDRDGRDEVVVGERQGGRSVYLYRATRADGGAWSKATIDAGGMAAAGCAVADLDADDAPDVVCIGTATANLKWYKPPAATTAGH